ncbi:MAG TPA: endonuclease/exonuclease/phosphatase family protein [Thermodesulfobacteriota bacterium]|nr:endonuclease/exonuclease/phosphatase family protein [Thermodesulfobacteriota bacterium]
MNIRPEMNPAKTRMRNHPLKGFSLLARASAAARRFLRRPALLIAVSIPLLILAGGGPSMEDWPTRTTPESLPGQLLRPVPNEVQAGTAEPPGLPAPGDGRESAVRARDGWIRFRIVTYNIHKGQGMDGAVLPSRIASVLNRLNPDIVALQEVVGSGKGEGGQEEEIGNILKMNSLLTPTRLLNGRAYGNAVLTRFPVESQSCCDISQKNREPRFCQRVDLLIEGRPVHVFNVHLGTSWKEREVQARQLVPFLSDPALKGPKILLGDFNEWFRGPATETLCKTFRSLDVQPFLTWPQTYPGFCPVFHIDHLYYKGDMKVAKVEAPRNWSTVIASDHMPLAVDLMIRAGG